MTTGDWIYPRNLKSYELMERLAAQNYLTPYVKIYCPNCNSSCTYKTISGLLAEIDCLNCGAHINTLGNARVVYKVNQHEKTT